jgi:hypothetical protein
VVGAVKVGTDTWTLEDPVVGSLMRVGLLGFVERVYVLPSTIMLMLAGVVGTTLDSG